MNDLAFGKAMGTSTGGVVAYSSDYKTVNNNEYMTRHDFHSYVDGIYLGYKWQCVEFARRWLYINKGYIFNNVAMAYEIFELTSVRDLTTNIELPLYAFKNGATRPPEIGSLLIWEEGGHFEETGHVAIITEVFDDKIHIAEQNMDFKKWPDGQAYSRTIKAKVGVSGDYWLQCPSTGTNILGWMIQTSNADFAYVQPQVDKTKFNIKALQTATHSNSTTVAKIQNLPWLNIANEDENAFVTAMGGHKLYTSDQFAHNYYQITPEAADALEIASDELHLMFMQATDYVLAHPTLLTQFGLPEAILPKIRKSWENRTNQLITSRFDFAMSAEGLKVYEYNCDSASCYMEVGKVQGKWLQHNEVKGGVDAGDKLFKKLVKAWKKCEIDGLVHVLQDNDPEETYHALFMKSAIEAAGYTCELIQGLDSLRKTKSGDVIDENGNTLRWIWKTWAWETALDDLRFADVITNEINETTTETTNANNHDLPLNLADVLLNDHIMVFEPLWTLIPSNKAILPVLWRMFPNHPYLLNADYALNDELKDNGYVSKPIVGRCGANIQLVSSDSKTLAEKTGYFDDRPMIYQQLFTLPKIDKQYVQISTFTAQGHYAGCGIRVDSSMIIGKDSDCLPLQIAFE